MLFIKHSIIHHCIYAVNIYLSRNDPDTGFPVGYRQTIYGKDFCSPLWEKQKYISRLLLIFKSKKQKFSIILRTLDREFYVKVFIHLHFSRRVFINKERKSSIIP